MKRILEVCLIELGLIIAFTVMSSGQAMQKGISVHMPSCSNATAVPEADKPDAVIVTVVANGKLYLGTQAVNKTELAAKLQQATSAGSKKMLYVKADEHSPYADVIAVMDAARGAGVEAITLLSAAKTKEEPGQRVPPQGFELRMVTSGR